MFSKAPLFTIKSQRLKITFRQRNNAITNIDPKDLDNKATGQNKYVTASTFTEAKLYFEAKSL